MGFHYDVCTDPSHNYRELFFNSCHHRACPSCNHLKADEWLKRQIARLIACDYYHVVFTVPHELIPLWQYNRDLFTKLMFKASWESLKEFFLDENHIGGLPGAIATFQSWDQRLAIHPHIHFLVTGGGIACDGKWQGTKKKNYLIPGRALAILFRGKFLAMLKRAIIPRANGKNEERLVIPDFIEDDERYLKNLGQLHEKKWTNAILGPYGHGRGVATYLARYIRGGPLKENRIKLVKADKVILEYKRNGEFDESLNVEMKTFELSISEFIRRFMEHVPSRYAYHSRTFGLFNPANKDLLNLAREKFGQLPLTAANEDGLDQNRADRSAFRVCPICKKQLKAVYPHGKNARAPPGEKPVLDGKK